MSKLSQKLAAIYSKVFPVHQAGRATAITWNQEISPRAQVWFGTRELGLIALHTDMQPTDLRSAPPKGNVSMISQAFH
jgi:hypothetical protein